VPAPLPSPAPEPLPKPLPESIPNPVNEPANDSAEQTVVLYVPSVFAALKGYFTAENGVHVRELPPKEKPATPEEALRILQNTEPDAETMLRAAVTVWTTGYEGTRRLYIACMGNGDYAKINRVELDKNDSAKQVLNKLALDVQNTINEFAKAKGLPTVGQPMVVMPESVTQKSADNKKKPAKKSNSRKGRKKGQAAVLIATLVSAGTIYLAHNPSGLFAQMLSYLFKSVTR
jgi:hypothetical protein